MGNLENITPIDQHVIDFVRELRIAKNITQQGLADILGLSRSFIKDVESINIASKYNLRHVNALADYFGISPREFLPERAFPVDVPAEKVVKKKLPAKKAAAKKAIKSNSWGLKRRF